MLVFSASQGLTKRRNFGLGILIISQEDESIQGSKDPNWLFIPTHDVVRIGPPTSDAIAHVLRG